MNHDYLRSKYCDPPKTPQLVSINHSPTFKYRSPSPFNSRFSIISNLGLSPVFLLTPARNAENKTRSAET